MSRPPRALAAGLSILLMAALGLADPARATTLDWASLAKQDTIEVLTQDEDGSPRETTVWVVVLGDQGYIRTGGTHWGDNVVRNPDVALRIGNETHPVRAEFIEDENLRLRIEDAFREKYGFSDWLIALFRGQRPKLMHLVPR